MRGLSIFLFILFFSCEAQTISKKMNIDFEDIYHHNFTIVPQKSLIIDSQVKMKEIYKTIYHHYGGKRSAPIPMISVNEMYLIVKPPLKSTNDVEITKVEFLNQNLYLTVKPFQNSEIQKDNRTAPNVLLKLNQKLLIKKVIINNQN